MARSDWTTATIESLLQSGAITVHKDGNHGSDYPRVEEFGLKGVSFLTAKSLSAGRVDIDGAPRLAEDKADKLRFGFLKPNDVLLSHNATVGRVAVVPKFNGRALIGTSLTSFRLNPTKLSPRYFAAYLSGIDFQQQLAAVMSQTTRNQVPITAQRRLHVVVPYLTDNKLSGDATEYVTPPGNLPASETEGHGELLARGKCFSNAPDLIRDYVSRPRLEQELLQLLLDDKRPIVTLVGRGGIGKTVLALKVIQCLYDKERYESVVWLSARDVDLQLSGPKPVRPVVVSPDDMGRLYASLVLSAGEMKAKGFNAREFLEKQLQNCEVGSTLFVFDNFETTQNPVEMFNWVDSFLRLPNKALITTRLRDFKGDYPVEVTGMDEREARKLVQQTAAHLEITHLLTPEYIDELISQSEGHPYVIKILLGEVSKAGRAANVPRLVAGSEDILTALFERTYAALTPCAQRAFLTLSAWNSAVPRLGLEAVLLRSTEERNEVERGIDSLLQFSMAEVQIAAADNQEFISLPLVASVFGKKKLNISPFKMAVQSDVEILRMLGPTRFTDSHLSLAKRLESFIANVSRRVETGASFESYSPILEMICRAYNPGWLLLARWHMESRTTDGYANAKDKLKRFLENEPSADEAAEAWRMLAEACFRTADALGEIHAFTERAQITSVPFYDVSNTANRLNELLHTRQLEIDRDEKRALAQRILTVLDSRRSEAAADDYSRMAWLAIHLGQ